MRVRDEFRWQLPPSFNFGPDVIDHLATHDRLGLIYIDRFGYRRDYAFSEIADLSQRYAGALRELGVTAGARILVALPPIAKALFVLLAIDRIGAVAIPCAPEIDGDDFALRAYESHATAAIVHGRTAEAATRLRELHEVRTILAIGTAVDGAERLDLRAEHAVPYRGAITPSGDDAFIIYKPGGEAIVHARRYLYAAYLQAQYYLDAHESDVVWPAGERANLHLGWNAFWGVWACGAAAVIHEAAFDAAERLDLAHELGVTILAQPPEAYRASLALPRFDTFRLDRVRRFISCGARLDAATAQAWHAATGRQLNNLYGTAETSVLVGDLAGETVLAGTLGRAAIGHEVAILDDESRCCPPEVEGVVALRGDPPTRFARHLDGEPAPREWLLTNDRARITAGGYFQLCSG